MDKKEVTDTARLFGRAALDGFREGVDNHEKETVRNAVDEQFYKDLDRAAAALVEAKVSDLKIVELLENYYRVQDVEAEAALGRGRILCAKKAKTDKKVNSPRRSNDK